jgi:hypothetical protein
MVQAHDLNTSTVYDFLHCFGYCPVSNIKLKSLVIALQVMLLLNFIISLPIRSGPALLPIWSLVQAHDFALPNIFSLKGSLRILMLISLQE